MKTTLKQLNVFVETAKSGSLSGATKACFLSQPAASMSLQTLEQILKAPLFDRIGKRLVLNSYGEHCLPKAIAIIEQAQDLESTLHTNLDTLTGNITIGCTKTIGNYLLPSYLARFKQHHPNIQCTQMMGNTDQTLLQLKAFHCDFALIEGAMIEDPRIVYEPWRQDTMVVISRADHPLSQKTTLSNEALENSKWILREKGSGTADIIEKHAYGQFKLNVENRLTSFEAIKHYVAQSDCLSILSTSAIKPADKQQLCILPTQNFTLTRPLTLAMLKDKYQSEASKTLRAFLFGLSCVKTYPK